MKLIYTGALPSGSVTFNGRDYLFKKGETIEVPEELGKELRPSKDWKEATEKKSDKENK